MMERPLFAQELYMSTKLESDEVKTLELNFSKEERSVLRELSKQIAELSQKPIEDKKRKLWYKHNRLEDTRPIIMCDPENGWNEIITKDKIRSKNKLARHWEFLLRRNIYRTKYFDDDTPLEKDFNIPYVFVESGWGLEEEEVGGKDGGSFKIKSPLKSYDDLDKLKYPKIEIISELTNEVFSLAEEIMGDILNVRKKGMWWWSLGLSETAARLRGLDKIMYDMYDNPEGLHKLMDFLKEGTIHKINFLEENGLLHLNNDGVNVGSGGLGYTNELPQKSYDENNIVPMDMWGFAESQVTSDISPKMFKEFIYQYQLPILERFGLNCYGCCEPLDLRWEIIKDIPRLRRVSVSPWADEIKMAEKLEDKYIYSRKPNPAVLAVDSIDEDLIRNQLRNTMNVTKKCHVEIIMKDNHTINSNPENVIRWCEIAKEESESLGS